MLKVCTSLLILAGCTAMYGQQLNPSQIRPGSNGQVLTTHNGIVSWMPGGGGSTPTGSVFHIASYDSSGVLAQTNYTTDSTGNALTVPGLLSAPESYLHGSETLCPQRSTNTNGSTCQKTVDIFSPVAPNYSYRPHDTNTILQGVGYYRGNVGDFGLSGAGAGYDGVYSDYNVVSQYSSAIAAIHSTAFYKYASGDAQMGYEYLFHQGGWFYRGDEGIYGNAVQIRETINYYAGTVAGVDSTGTLISMSAPTGGRIPSAFVGGTMLDITKGGTLACQLDGTSSVVQGYLNSFGVTGCTLPVTTAWATLPTIATPATQANVTTPATVTATLQPIGGSTPAFPVGQSICTIISDTGTFEQTQVTASAASGTSQSVTLNLLDSYIIGQHPVVLACGGVANQYVSADANLTLSGMRTTYPAILSLDSSHIVIARIAGGGTTGGPDPAEAWQPSGNNSAFHLYPGARILATNMVTTVDSGGDPRTTNGQPVQVSSNSAGFASGDVIESPNGMATLVSSIVSVGNVLYSPCLTQARCSLENLEVSGRGVSSGFVLQRIRNSEPVSTYNISVAPGTTNPPPTVMPPDRLDIFGVIGTDTGMGAMPVTAQFDYQNCNNPGDASGNYVHTLFYLPSTAGNHATRVSYDCAALSINFVNLKTASFDVAFNDSFHTHHTEQAIASYNNPLFISADNQLYFCAGGVAGPNLPLSYVGAATPPTHCANGASLQPSGGWYVGPYAGTFDPGAGAMAAVTGQFSSLTSGNCLQASTGGLLTTTSGPCSTSSTILRTTVAATSVVEGTCTTFTATLTGLTSTMTISASAQSNPMGATTSTFYSAANTAGLIVCALQSNTSAVTYNISAQ